MGKITFYRFLSEIRFFLSRLIKTPNIKKSSEFLEANGLSKKRLINDLMNIGVLERSEKIKDKTDSDEFVEAIYFVRYKVRKKNFERNIKRLFSRYFENDDKKINESDMMFIPKTVFKGEGEMADKIRGIDPAYNERGGLNTPISMNECDSSDSGGMFGNAGNNGRGAYSAPISKKPLRRTITISEEQFNYIQSIINECNAADEELVEATVDGNGGLPGEYTAPGFDTSKDKSFWADSLDR